MAIAYIDPVAQTFFVDAATYPKGMFVHSIDLVFKKKDEITFQPFTLQLRPTVNGYPHSTLIHSGAAIGQVSLRPDKINVVTGVGSDVPNIDDSNHYTRFQFPAPVFLMPGEHAIVLFTNSDDYEVFIAEIGGTRLDGSDRRVDKQVYTGSFFKSQNGSTYTAFQDIDLMFRVNACDFTVGSSTVLLKSNRSTTNVEYDLIKVASQELTFEPTSLSYDYKLTSNSTGTLDSDFSNILSNDDYVLDSRKISLSTSDNTAIIQMTLGTSDNTVSTMVDTGRLHMIAVKNIINDCGLEASNFTITDGGSSYSSNGTVTITGSKGSGATAVAVANVTSGKIESIVVTAAGSGYTEDITATISGGGGSGATVSVESETNSSGGPAIAKYITRKVTLADGFDANMIRVYLTAYQPAQATIEVYYKVMADEDYSNFSDRPWVRMLNVQQGNESLLNTLKSQVKTDFFEYLFIPSTTDTSYISSNGNSYPTFKTWAIKIVLRTSNTAYIPIVRDLRAIALAP